MVFRKENKVDAFQRQISALRQQLGTDATGDDPAGPSLEERSEGHEPMPSSGHAMGATSDFSFAGFPLGPEIDAAAVPARQFPPSIPASAVDVQTSVIAHDAVWKGDLQTNGTIHVHGRMGGTISARDDVYVAEEADVDATVTATNVVVAGMVRGTIRCSSRFEVLPQGRVTGDVQAPTLVVHEGAIVSGQFRMGPSDQNATAERPVPVVQRRTARGG